MFGRIELAWPVRDARLRQRVIDECLVPYLHDSLDAWTSCPTVTTAARAPRAQVRNRH